MVSPELNISKIYDNNSSLTIYLDTIFVVLEQSKSLYEIILILKEEFNKIIIDKVSVAYLTFVIKEENLIEDAEFFYIVVNTIIKELTNSYNNNPLKREVKIFLEIKGRGKYYSENSLNYKPLFKDQFFIKVIESLLFHNILLTELCVKASDLKLPSISGSIEIEFFNCLVRLDEPLNIYKSNTKISNSYDLTIKYSGILLYQEEDVKISTRNIKSLTLLSNYFFNTNLKNERDITKEEMKPSTKNINLIINQTGLGSGLEKLSILAFSPRNLNITFNNKVKIDRLVISSCDLTLIDCKSFQLVKDVDLSFVRLNLLIDKEELTNEINNKYLRINYCKLVNSSKEDELTQFLYNLLNGPLIKRCELNISNYTFKLPTLNEDSNLEYLEIKNKQSYDFITSEILDSYIDSNSFKCLRIVRSLNQDITVLKDLFISNKLGVIIKDNDERNISTFPFRKQRCSSFNELNTFNKLALNSISDWPFDWFRKLHIVYEWESSLNDPQLTRLLLTYLVIKGPEQLAHIYANNLSLLDKDKEYKLWHLVMKLRDERINTNSIEINILQMQCPSTLNFHYLFVPSFFDNVDESILWVNRGLNNLIADS